MYLNNEFRYHHDHKHGHHHHHDHSHSSADKSDIEKLSILLAHWIDHNKTHTESFEEWAKKAESIGKQETADNIRKAIEMMDKANEMLAEAKKSI